MFKYKDRIERDSSEGSSDEQPKRRRRHKPIRRPDNKIIPISNTDKKHTEAWTERRARDIGNFPNPSRILLLGPCGVGKSTLIKNLIMHQNPPFSEVHLIHQDAEYTEEYDDLEPTDKLSDVPDLAYWDLNDGPYKKRAVIIDDLELTAANKERMKNLAILFRYASTHRGLTIYFAHQSFFDIPPLLKKMASIYILWKPRSRNELDLIENRTGLEKDTLKDLFSTVATKHRDSICIDLSENTPCKLRLNIWDRLEPVSD